MPAIGGKRSGAAALAVATAAATAAACGASEETAWLGLPPHEGASALLLAVPTRDGLALSAHPLEGASPRVRLRASELGGDRLFAVSSEATLAESGLDPGPIPRAAAGERSRPLLGGDHPVVAGQPRLFSARASRIEAGWNPDVPPEELQFFPVRLSGPPCPSFGAATAHANLPGRIRYGVPLEGGLALVGTTDGAWRVSSSGVATEPSPSSARVTAATRAGPHVWLGDAGGRVFRVPASAPQLRDEAVQIGSLGVADVVSSLVAGAPDDAFALTRGGHLMHWDGVEWRALGTLEGWRGQLAWVAPGEAVVSSDRAGLIYRARAGRLTQEAATDAGFSAMAFIEGVGLVAGSTDGELFVSRPTGWSTVPETRFGWWVLSLAPMERGVLFLLASGFVGHYRPDTGLCTDLFYDRILADGVVVPLPEGLLIFGEQPRVDEVTVMYLPRS